MPWNCGVARVFAVQVLLHLPLVAWGVRPILPVCASPPAFRGWGVSVRSPSFSGRSRYRLLWLLAPSFGVGLPVPNGGCLRVLASVASVAVVLRPVLPAVPLHLLLVGVACRVLSFAGADGVALARVWAVSPIFVVGLPCPDGLCLRRCLDWLKYLFNGWRCLRYWSSCPY